MKVSNIAIRNFRRLEDVEFSLEDDSTLFVGPNNSGKTSATAAFRLFFRRGEFTINDFTVACIKKLNDFGFDPQKTADDLPKIEMDVWFSINPEIEFGRAFTLVPDVTQDFDKVGIRMKFHAQDASKLRAEYIATFPPSNEKQSKSLADFLALSRNLSRHYSISYFVLENGTPKETLIEPEEGKRVLNSLVRIDFIDAQRNIHDQDSGRHNRLSAAFAAYYRHNLEKPDENEAATRIIDENNTSLTAHYDRHFEKLLSTIASLGVPSAHDRTLRLVSSLNPQDALQGNTELYYVDAALQHQLPEAYNGLGFKNLVYMAIQVSHFHTQWMTTDINRPLCQLIFIEEPEVHLHAQVQQVFITNICKILEETAKATGEDFVAPQLAISTHSSHIVDTVKFEKVRYFRRSPMKGATGIENAPLIATRVLNLQNFKPHSTKEIALTEKEKKGLTPEQETDALSRKVAAANLETLNFLKKYLKLTHCDLFFADAAVLVEGTAEKLLLSQMIETSAPSLLNRYLTVLEVGGAYAHRFASLLSFLGIPFLVITDIDTVDPKNVQTACPANQPGAVTSNAALKFFFNKATRDDFVALLRENQIVADGSCFVAFQRPVIVELAGASHELHGRTFEEAFIYENIELFRSKLLNVGYDLAQEPTATELTKATYDRVRSGTFKKTEFALGVAASDGWKTPHYIADGLIWLAEKLLPKAAAGGG